MENRQSNEDVSRLIRGSMRPYDEPEAGESAPVRGGPKAAAVPRASKLKSLLTGETLLNLVCAAFAVAFIALAASGVSLSGNFISIDNLFFTSVCLLLAGLFAVQPALTLREKGLLKNPFAASEAAPAVEEGPIHFEGSTRMFLYVLGGLLGLTLVEVALAYFNVPPAIMLGIVMALSLVKAGLIMAYFMHLRFERMSLVLTVVPAMVVCITLLLFFFPDSFRLNKLRPAQSAATTTTTTTEAGH